MFSVGAVAPETATVFLRHWYVSDEPVAPTVNVALPPTQALCGKGCVPIDVVVGFYERWRETLHNSAAYITIGLDDGPPILRHVIWRSSAS